MNIKKALYIVLGLIALAFGGIGVVVPMLPSFPFLMLATFCFANSSEKLHNWFINTKMYKENLESYVASRGMTKKAKKKIMTTVTILMSFGFAAMMIRGVYLPCIILGIVWTIHALYFSFGVKTIDKHSAAAQHNHSIQYE